MPVPLMMIVGAALGVEWRLDRREPRAKPAQHVFDDVIAPDAQPLARDLHVDVAIADMPGEPCQIVAIRSGDFDQRLGPPDHADDCAILEHQSVAVAQRGGLRKIEQEFRAALAAQHDPPAMAVMRIKRDRIDGFRLVPMPGRFDVVCALHDGASFVQFGPPGSHTVILTTALRSHHMHCRRSEMYGIKACAASVTAMAVPVAVGYTG